MSFSRPTLKELVERVSLDISSQLGKGAPQRRSFTYAISYAIAGVSHLLYGFLDWIYKQIFADTASPENLLRHTDGVVERRKASFAQREFKFTGTNGSVIPKDTILNRADGIQFKTLSDATITLGEATAIGIAIESGSNSNTPFGSKLNFQSSISGVNGQAEVVSSNSINGEDEETIESLRERYLDKIRKPPHGGNENDYKQWVLEVPGVTRAFVYPKRMGLGTVGISFLMDNEEDIIPNEAKVQEVQEYVDSLRPVTSEVWVFAPESEEVDFVIHIKPNTESVRREIENEIRDLFKRDAEPDRIMAISKINEAISIANGEDDHILMSPSANIVPQVGKILVPGNFEFYTL